VQKEQVWAVAYLFTRDSRKVSTNKSPVFY
jgi:hypothetical protein